MQAFRDYEIDKYLLGIPKAKRLSLLHFRRKLADTLNFVQQNECTERALQNRNSPITTVTPRRPGDVHPSTEAHFPIRHVPAMMIGLEHIAY
ncbi:unnamed protein product [Leptidea sinapis]|uniref:Uncharacterized protein n=1 Tax=Leptidea sinapis TaxID=189913 RepID=A0A5E4QSJ0_9NEOP|nr:unnamed protein product [Leptidea sinapis]